jgi:2-polyprenyl-6-hydroxyphenyl methylase/3-demethylubiquinone-9 3-methyltransferase
MLYSYYDDNLSAERLKRVYDIAPLRVKRYLKAEIDHVLGRIGPAEVVLELGCGYGRVMSYLAAAAGVVFGIDTSPGSLLLGKQELAGLSNCWLVCMNAVDLGFRDHAFDCVVCLQNGISAFHLDKLELVREAVRVTRPGGRTLFSTYAERFWDDRLEWFRLQAEAGLLGEIDYEKTGDGVIVCRDGFTATTVGPDAFTALTRDIDADVHLVEVDQSSLFCEITP